MILQKKSQIISMDFVLTFVVYIFALSIFFFGLKNNLIIESKSKFDLDPEIVFNKLENIYNEDIDFLDGIKIDSQKFDNFKNYDSVLFYDFIFKDLMPRSLKKVSLCFFLENKNNQIIYTKALLPNSNSDNYIYFFENNNNKIFCGNSGSIYSKPKCELKESILIKRHVLYNKDIYLLNILACGE